MKMNEVVSQQSIRFPQEAVRSETTPESITALLNALFPEQKQEEKELRQVKVILGDLSRMLTIDEIHTMISEIQYLVTVWLDAYEEDLFKGKTLKEVLNEG